MVCLSLVSLGKRGDKFRKKLKMSTDFFMLGYNEYFASISKLYCQGGKSIFEVEVRAEILISLPKCNKILRLNKCYILLS